MFTSNFINPQPVLLFSATDIPQGNTKFLSSSLQWAYIRVELGLTSLEATRLRPGFPCGNIIIINVLVNKSNIVARVKVLQEWNCWNCEIIARVKNEIVANLAATLEELSLNIPS